MTVYGDWQVQKNIQQAQDIGTPSDVLPAKEASVRNEAIVQAMSSMGLEPEVVQLLEAQLDGYQPGTQIRLT